MLLCVAGPTACYKSDTAIQLAKYFGGEILSCDAVSVYKGLDIGSAKPTVAERSSVPHHLIDVADPKDRSFTVSAYKELADAAIIDCGSRNKIPIVCGGSGLYFDSILHDMQYVCPSSIEIRNELSRKYDANPEAFLARLKAVDAFSADRIPLHDKKRLVRAYEVFQLTGAPFSSFNKDYMEAQSRFRYDSIRIGLTLPREKLYDRINKRVDLMMERGLLEEVKGLYDDGLNISYPAMQSIGYKQLILYFDGECSLSSAVEEIKKASRHLAKRQFTWFKRDSGITWFDCSDINKATDDIISYIKVRIHESI